VKQYVKFAARANSLQEIPGVITAAFAESLNVSPGPVYIDLPSDVLMQSGDDEVQASLDAVPAGHEPVLVKADPSVIDTAATLIRSAAK